MNWYEIEVFAINRQPQITVHRVQAHSAEDALFEFDFNHCRKSMILESDMWVTTSRVHLIRSVDNETKTAPALASELSSTSVAPETTATQQSSGSQTGTD